MTVTHITLPTDDGPVTVPVYSLPASSATRSADETDQD